MTNVFIKRRCIGSRRRQDFFPFWRKFQNRIVLSPVLCIHRPSTRFDSNGCTRFYRSDCSHRVLPKMKDLRVSGSRNCIGQWPDEYIAAVDHAYTGPYRSDPKLLRSLLFCSVLLRRKERIAFVKERGSSSHMSHRKIIRLLVKSGFRIVRPFFSSLVPDVTSWTQTQSIEQVWF